jgi:opacity protein-like surface antigen
MEININRVLSRGERRMKRFLSIALALMAVVVMMSSIAVAQTQTVTNQENEWQFDITPYLWLSGIQGDVKSGRFSSGGAEASFSDIFQDLNAAFMGAFEVRKGKLGILLDTIYLNFSGTKNTPDSSIGEVETNLKVGLYSLAGEYRIVEKPLALDFLLGARYATISADLDILPGKYPQILEGRSVSDSMNYWDGFAGMRALFPLSENWSLMGYFDLGGGGSNFTFQGIAGINYQISKHFVIKGGYRYLAIDADDSKFVYDVQLGGPYLGLGLRF